MSEEQRILTFVLIGVGLFLVAVLLDMVDHVRKNDHPYKFQAHMLLIIPGWPIFLALGVLVFAILIPLTWVCKTLARGFEELLREWVNAKPLKEEKEEELKVI